MGVPWSQQGRDGRLTDTQRFYLEAMGRWAEENQSMPTCRELAKDAGVTFGAVGNILRRLRAKGYLASGPRGRMEFTDKGRQALGVSE